MFISLIISPYVWKQGPISFLEEDKCYRATSLTLLCKYIYIYIRMIKGRGLIFPLACFVKSTKPQDETNEKFLF